MLFLTTFNHITYVISHLKLHLFIVSLQYILITCERVFVLYKTLLIVYNTF